ncbi:DUF1294 domain-containing protein [Paracidovorax avenae]
MGGWPGALVAQQVLRHKSTKAEFRRPACPRAAASMPAAGPRTAG